jgi:SnoaL-like protein
MILGNLPIPIPAFLLALERRDTAALIATLSEQVVFFEPGKDSAGGIAEIRSWSDALCADAYFAVRPLYNSHAAGFTTLIVLLTTTERRVGPASHVQLCWRFRTSAGRITEIAISPEPLPQMPPVISTFILGVNTGDLDALLSTFAVDALVNDQLSEYRGRGAIREWAAQDVVGEKLTLYVVNATQHHGHVVLKAHVDGTFEKRGLPDPLVLALYFSAQGDEIVQLIILRQA